MKKNIPVKDRLNLYLVENKLKPSAMIDFFPGEVDNFENYHNSTFGRYKFNVSKKDIEKFESYLKSKNIIFVRRGFLKNTINFGKSKKGTYQVASYFIAKDKDALENLINAKSDLEVGLALGFPNNSVESYKKILNDERRDGTYVPVAMGKARKSNIEIPSWISYLSFVPREVDILNRNFDDESKGLGEKYMNFVRENNPVLAKEVEDEKNNPLIPTGWEKAKDGGYHLYYNNFVPKSLEDQSRDLTKKLFGLGAVAGFVFSLFFLSSNVTGNVIGNAGASSNNVAGIITLTASFLLAFLALRK